jgi:glycerate kinase
VAELVDAPGLGPGPFGGGGSSPLVRTLPHLVAAPDKFRGTATAADVAAAASRGARAVGWSAEEIPLADGGEGTLDVLARALSGERRDVTVRGPLGEPVEAEWLFVPHGLPRGIPLLSDAAGTVPGAEEGPVALIESALAAGRALLAQPTGDDPVRARTDGVGDLILAAVESGARLVVVGAGGTATTDGGWGALSAVGSRARLRGTSIVVACDVSTPFHKAAEIFSRQKGATPAQVAALSARLDRLATHYRDAFGIDVGPLAGGGAGGGLAGGLAALGAHLVPGFALVAALFDLDRRIARADLVMTGEGRVDETSFEGKVVGGVLAAAGGRVPALCVAGQLEPGVERHWSQRRGRVDAVSLVVVAGDDRAHLAPADAVSDVVAAVCRQGGGDDVQLASSR